MPALILEVEPHLLNHEHGHWCTHCQLPSAVLIHGVLTLRRDPTRTLSRFTVLACHDCGRTSSIRRT